jgi:hypothetical protein
LAIVLSVLLQLTAFCCFAFHNHVCHCLEKVIKINAHYLFLLKFFSTLLSVFSPHACWTICVMKVPYFYLTKSMLWSINLHVLDDNRRYFFKNTDGKFWKAWPIKIFEYTCHQRLKQVNHNMKSVVNLFTIIYQTCGVLFIFKFLWWRFYSLILGFLQLSWSNEKPTKYHTVIVVMRSRNTTIQWHMSHKNNNNRFNIDSVLEFHFDFL